MPRLIGICKLPAMVRLVLFDIDGTLIRTGGAGVKAFAKVFETEFGARDGFEKLKFAGRTDFSLVREFFAVHQIAPIEENYSRFMERYVFWLDDILHQCHCEVIDGVGQMIEGLRTLETPPILGLLTGNIRLGAEIKLRHVGLWETFAMGAFADDSEERDKIAAMAMERGTRLLKRNLAGSEVVVIGDTPLDIRCARAIGAKVLAVATGGHPLDELQSHRPEWAVASLTEIDPAQVVHGF